MQKRKETGERSGYVMLLRSRRKGDVMKTTKQDGHHSMKFPFTASEEVKDL